MFFASWAATAGQDPLPMGSIPFPVWGRGFPLAPSADIASEAAHTVMHTAASALMGPRLRLDEPEHQPALPGERRVDRRDAGRRPLERKLELHRTRALDESLPLRGARSDLDGRIGGVGL